MGALGRTWEALGVQSGALGALLDIKVSSWISECLFERLTEVEGLVRRDVRCQRRGGRLRLRACKDLVNINNRSTRLYHLLKRCGGLQALRAVRRTRFVFLSDTVRSLVMVYISAQ